MLSAVGQDVADERPLRRDSLVQHEQNVRLTAAGGAAVRTLAVGAASGDEARQLFEQRPRGGRFVGEARCRASRVGVAVRQPLEPVPGIDPVGGNCRSDREVGRRVQRRRLGDERPGQRVHALPAVHGEGRDAELRKRHGDRHCRDRRVPARQLLGLAAQALAPARVEPHREQRGQVGTARPQCEEVLVVGPPLPEPRIERTGAPQKLGEGGCLRSSPMGLVAPLGLELSPGALPDAARYSRECFSNPLRPLRRSSM